MVIRFECEHCGKRMQVDDQLAGKRGKCPQCNERLTVPEYDEGNFLDEDLSSYDEPPGQAQSLNKVCPMCGEMIPRNSSSCPSCGEQLKDPAKKKKRARSGSGDLTEESKIALQIFITGLLGCFSPFVAIYGIVFLIRHPHDYPRKTLAIIGTLLHCFWTAFLIFRITSGNL